MHGYSIFIKTKGCIFSKNGSKQVVQEKNNPTYMFTYSIATFTF